MRAAAVLAAALLIASAAWADPAPQPVGADVHAAIQQISAGQREEGRAVLEKLAHAGRADAAEALGEMISNGVLGFKADTVAGCGYYALGATGRGDTAHNTAFCYERGMFGAAPDMAKAAEFYKRGAELGYAKSKCALGNLYRSGRGVPQDIPRGLALCREAAEAGIADAQTDLGDAYLMGQGVTADTPTARGWYEKAADQNQRNALMTLGQIYWNGDGVAKDNAKAAEFWRRSYAAGRMDAAKFAGDEAFLRATVSKGVWTIDGLQEAHDWYVKAAQAETPAVRAQAADRATLTEQLKGVMQRIGKAN